MYYSYCTVCTEAKDVCPRTVLCVLDADVCKQLSGRAVAQWIDSAVHYYYK